MDEIKFSTQSLIEYLREHGCEPTEEFDAAAGRDYGHVEAWDFPEGKYGIMYGNNGSTDYAIASEIDDLAVWLESPDLCGLDMISQTAMVRGMEAVEEASEDAEGPFFILRTRYWYGVSETSVFVDSDDGQTEGEFATYQDAQEWIESEQCAVYTLSHNESGSPSYKIVSE